VVPNPGGINEQPQPRAKLHHIVKIVTILAVVVVIIAILIASARPLPGLRDITAALPALVDLVTAFRK
jgi:hypothetical protein